MIVTPTTPTGPGQWAVIAWVSILGCVAIGALCLVASFRYAGERPVAAREFRNIGLGFFATAIVGSVAKRLASRLMD